MLAVGLAPAPWPWPKAAGTLWGCAILPLCGGSADTLPLSGLGKSWGWWGPPRVCSLSSFGALIPLESGLSGAGFKAFTGEPNSSGFKSYFLAC